MDQNATFEHILREKMGAPLETAETFAPFCPVWPLPERPLSAVFFNRRVFIRTLGHKAYPQNRSPQKINTTREEQKHTEKGPDLRSEPLWDSQSLSKNGQKRISLLIKLGAQIEPHAFTLSQLKQQYRKLLKRYHPDLNQTASTAQTLSQVVSVYRNLLKEISSSENQLKV